MRQFADATAIPYGYLVLDLKSSTSEHNRLQTDIFDSVNQQSRFRFQNPIIQENIEQFKGEAYEERGFSSDKAIHLAAYDDLPSLRKRLRQDYAQFQIDFYELHGQEDPVEQRILESAKTFKNQHDMNQVDSIRQAIKLRKDLFMDVWPNHKI